MIWLRPALVREQMCYSSRLGEAFLGVKKARCGLFHMGGTRYISLLNQRSCAFWLESTVMLSSLWNPVHIHIPYVLNLCIVQYCRYVVGWACVDGRVKSCISDFAACGRPAYFSFPCAKTLSILRFFGCLYILLIQIATQWLRNGLLRCIPYTCPNLWCNPCSKCYAMDCFGAYLTLSKPVM